MFKFHQGPLKHIQQQFCIISMSPHPDFDTGAGGGTQPVTVGAEAKGVDDVAAVQGVQVLALVQVPQHGLTVLMEKRQEP